jgi:hypothetical protein
MTPVDATFVTAGLAALIAIWGVITQRQIASRRATLDYIVDWKSNRELIKARLEFIKLAKAPGGLAPWADKEKEHTIEAQYIGEILNRYELTSIGIQRGILDYKLYRMLRRTVTIRDWNHAHPYAVSLRNRLENPIIYHEFEEMVRWLKDDKPPRRRLWWGKFF